MGIEITKGTLQVCEAYAMTKAKQKNVPKTSEHELATTDGRRVFLEIATVKKPKGGQNVTKPNWCIVVDEHSAHIVGALSHLRY